jgi:flagellar basal-body rod protein FlgC
MAINGLGTPLSALQANQFRQDVSANNVANVNTEGFKASAVQTSDAAYINDIGQGTQVSGTYAPPRPGPMAMAATGAGSGVGSGMVEQSNTDMVTETTNQMGAQNAYGVNAAVMRSADQATQTLLDMTA